jgi:hypothetical protein
MEAHKPTVPQIDVVGPTQRGGAGRPATGFFAEMEKNTNCAFLVIMYRTSYLEYC